MTLKSCGKIEADSKDVDREKGQMNEVNLLSMLVKSLSGTLGVCYLDNAEFLAEDM